MIRPRRRSLGWLTTVACLAAGLAGCAHTSDQAPPLLRDERDESDFSMTVRETGQSETAPTALPANEGDRAEPSAARPRLSKTVTLGQGTEEAYQPSPATTP